MIEIGKQCTIWPDSQVVYEITLVKSRSIKIKLDEKIIEELYHYANLKEVSGNSMIENVPIYNINLLIE